MTRAIDRTGHWLADARLAVPLLAIGVFGTGPAGERQPDWTRTADHGAYALVVVATASLVVRRPWPALALALNASSVALYLAVGYPFGPILLTVPVLTYAVAARWPRPRAAIGVATSFGLLLAATLVRIAYVGGQWGQLTLTGLAWATVVAAAFALGVTARVRRESAAGVRVEQARRAVSEERLRMAQDLHDVVGHGLAVIAMQAGVGLHLLDRDPTKVRESLEAIRATSRESLAGLRAELAQLRATSDEVGARRPQPGLADLSTLAQRIRAGGVDVTVDADQDLDRVPTEVGATAYRIVQESLTNVLRHAGTSHARVRVQADPGVLLVEVTDSGRGGAVNGDGSGIRGMRTRAESLGGSLHAGPRPTGGFAVSARLPLEQGSHR